VALVPFRATQPSFYIYAVFWAPFKFQLTLSAQPLAGLGWRVQPASS
jgi:hypothetical protein